MTVGPLLDQRTAELSDPGGILVRMFEKGSFGVTVAALEGTDVRSTSTRELVELLSATAAVAAWAESVGLTAVAELTRRRRHEHLRGGGGLAAQHADEIDAFIGSEVGAALRLSRDAARDRMALAEDLVHRLPTTLKALREGRLHAAHARRISEVTTGLTDEATGSVEHRVLRRAAADGATQTPAQTAAACRRAVLAVDPDSTRVRCQAAQRARHAGIRPLPDGMATLWVTGRADVVATAWARVDALAERGAEPGGQRADGRDGGQAGGSADGPATTLDQRRADTMLQLLAGTSDRPADVPGVEVRLDVVAPIGTVLGLSDEPGELPGHGPLPGPLVRLLAGDAVWRRFLSDESGVVVGVGRTRYRPGAALADAVRARDLTCRFPGCRRRASRCDLDHCVAWPMGGTHPDNMACLCRHHHRLKHRAGWRLAQHPTGHLTWTSPSGARYTTYPPTWDTGLPPPPEGADELASAWTTWDADDLSTSALTRGAAEALATSALPMRADPP